MTFGARETHRLNGRPFHLYEFRFGETETAVRRFTNLAKAFSGPATLADGTVTTATYVPLTISHGEVVSSGSLDKSELPVTLPESGGLSDLFDDEVPSAVITLTIRQGHVGDSDFKVHWAGKVLGASYAREEMTLSCEPISTSMRRSGLTKDWQLGCGHLLYGPDCRADRAASTITRIVSAVDGPRVTLGDWEAEDRRPYYVGGIIEWIDSTGRLSRRSITSIENPTQIVMSASSMRLTAGTSVSLILGCDKSMATCRSVFANILNYGGEPEIPLVNPTGVTNNYY